MLWAERLIRFSFNNPCEDYLFTFNLHISSSGVEVIPEKDFRVDCKMSSHYKVPTKLTVTIHSISITKKDNQ